MEYPVYIYTTPAIDIHPDELRWAVMCDKNMAVEADNVWINNYKQFCSEKIEKSIDILEYPEYFCMPFDTNRVGMEIEKFKQEFPKNREGWYGQVPNQNRTYGGFNNNRYDSRSDNRSDSTQGYSNRFNRFDNNNSNTNRFDNTNTNRFDNTNNNTNRFDNNNTNRFDTNRFDTNRFDNRVDRQAVPQQPSFEYPNSNYKGKNFKSFEERFGYSKNTSEPKDNNRTGYLNSNNYVNRGDNSSNSSLNSSNSSLNSSNGSLNSSNYSDNSSMSERSFDRVPGSAQKKDQNEDNSKEYDQFNVPYNYK